MIKEETSILDLKKPTLEYGTDFFSYDLSYLFPLHLVITSPPIKILDEKLHAIFEKLIAVMHPDGWILFDMPSGYNNRLTQLFSALMSHGWHWAHFYLVENMYPRHTQSLYAIKRKHNFATQPKVEGEQYYNRLACDPQRRSHRCEFDKDLIRRLIRAYSKRGDTVLDPFMGTASVPKVAHKLRRHGVGIEIRENNGQRPI